ncbi:MAG: hypothetical protein HZA03_11855 [Nitrospinae bacterium]|nr:hypothetical protein [Nitrospinota bacterium]
MEFPEDEKKWGGQWEVPTPNRRGGNSRYFHLQQRISNHHAARWVFVINGVAAYEKAVLYTKVSIAI